MKPKRPYSSKSQDDSAAFFIERFKLADADLKLAIDNGDDDEIERASRVVDSAIEQLLEFNCSSRTESRSLMRFLLDRFVLNETGADGLRRRVCDKVLSAI